MGTNQFPIYQPSTHSSIRWNTFLKLRNIASITLSATLLRMQRWRGTNVWPHRDNFFSVLTHTGLKIHPEWFSGFHQPSCFDLCAHFPSPSIPHIRSTRLAPFPLPATPRGTLGCLMFLECSLAWHDMSLGHIEELSFCSPNKSTHLPCSVWWSFSLMNDRKESEGEQCSFLFACVHVIPHKPQQANNRLFLKASPILFTVVWSYPQLLLS